MDTYLTLCIQETPKLLQYTVCKGKNDLQTKEYIIV